jgi:hypothetical protein
MKEGQALAEFLGFVIGLDSQALPCVQRSKALLEFCQNVPVHFRNPRDCVPLPMVAEKGGRALGFIAAASDGR